MSDINGIFHDELGSKLHIMNADDATGTFSGTFTVGGRIFDIAYGHYRFKDGGGSETLAVLAFYTDENTNGAAYEYQVTALYSPDRFATIVEAYGAGVGFNGVGGVNPYKLTRQVPQPR